MYNVYVVWDDEAKVWVATSNDIIGLVLEGDSVTALIERVCLIVKELLPLNNQKSEKLNFIIK